MATNWNKNSKDEVLQIKLEEFSRNQIENPAGASLAGFFVSRRDGHPLPDGKPFICVILYCIRKQLRRIGPKMRTGYPVEQAGAAGAPAAAPDEIDRLLRRLFPLNRSLTGDGNRETFRILADHNVPLAVEEIPSGTRVFDWTVPPEWRIRDAYILNGQGRKIVDLARSNTHVVSYSIPVDAEMTEAELLPHLHTLPGMPDAWPYRTSYYRRSWGFCISEQMRYAPDFFGPFPRAD